MKKRPSFLISIGVLLIFFDFFLVFSHIFLRNSLGFFDLDKEGSLKAVLSGFQLMVSGFCAGFIAFLSSRMRASRPFMALWMCVSVLFFYLALDDMMMLHERIGFVMNHWTGLHGSFESFNWLLYFLPCIIFGVFIFILAVRSLFFIEPRVRVLALLGLSGFFLTLLTEALGGHILKIGMISLYQQSIIFEEAFLLFGETFFLIALIFGSITLFSKVYILKNDVKFEVPHK